MKELGSFSCRPVPVTSSFEAVAGGLAAALAVYLLLALLKPEWDQ